MQRGSPSIAVISVSTFQAQIIISCLQAGIKAHFQSCARSGFGELEGLSADLILIDCSALTNDSIRSHLAQFGSSHPLPISGLFNLPAGCGIEKTALGLGARGFLYENDEIQTLVSMVSNLLKGECWVPRQILLECALSCAETIWERPTRPLPELTRRESEILRLLTEGHSNAAIATRLFISHHTVKTHVYNIFRKIEVPNRTKAAAWYMRNASGNSHLPVVTQ